MTPAPAGGQGPALPGNGATFAGLRRKPAPPRPGLLAAAPARKVRRMADPRSPVRYRDEIETPRPEEAETIERIIAAMTRESGVTAARCGHAIRASHAKSHGLLKGELQVLEGLPPELAQGLFARPRRYPVLARLSNAPGEILADSVSTQRGMALKVLGVEGERLPGHDAATQDFVLDTGTRFGNADAAGFLATILALEQATRMPQALKSAVSGAARAANAALNAMGRDNALLDFLGHPPRHPLAEPYFTQAPIRYGDYIAKLGIFPATPDLAALPHIDLSKDPDALRTATVAWFRQQPAAFEVQVQLCTDLDRMPVEDASVDWPQEESPYRTVARLYLPAQEACGPVRRRFMDDVLSFCPSHSLAAHRPLGSLMRARLRAYPALAAWRRSRNGTEAREPGTPEEVPD
jgi:hypothetical protein